MSQQSPFSGSSSKSPLPVVPAAALAATVVLACLTGCSAPDEGIPPAEVKPVTAYGLRLDTTATPKQVAFVLLRSIADDVQAAQAHDTTRQKEALRLTHSLAAYSTIAARIGESPNRPADAARSKARDRRLYTFVKDWPRSPPTISAVSTPTSRPPAVKCWSRMKPQPPFTCCMMCATTRPKPTRPGNRRPPSPSN
jgi:hypothetical protein